MTEYVSIYATFSSQDQAIAIGRLLVEEELAACVNVIPALQSIYMWDGKVTQVTECAFLAKTRQQLVPQLTARIVELHSYQVPCVVALPIISGHQPYLDWIAENTKSPAATPSP